MVKSVDGICCVGKYITLRPPAGMCHAQVKPPDPQPPAEPPDPPAGVPHCDEKTENTRSDFFEPHPGQAGPLSLPPGPALNCSKTLPHLPQRYS